MALTFKAVVTPAVVAFYERDYYRWLIENANLLRTGRVSEADLDRIAEELEEMGRSERRALASHISVQVSHLLKWQFQSSHRSSSWRGSIQNARSSIQDLLDESPSLRDQLTPLVVSKYPNARFNAANETNLPESTFPDDCPYRLEDLLNVDFWPD